MHIINWVYNLNYRSFHRSQCVDSREIWRRPQYVREKVSKVVRVISDIILCMGGPEINISSYECCYSKKNCIPV